jgi:hypothetical protein
VGAGQVKYFFGLRGSDRWMLIQALILLPATALGIRVAGFGRCYKGLGRLAPRARATTPGSEHAALVIRRALEVMDVAEHRGLSGGTCLSRSLVLWWLLRRKGIETDLRIGARSLNGAVDAHAWLEHEGRPINDTEGVAQRYSAFDKVRQPW